MTKEINVSLNNLDDEEMMEHQSRLRRYGYKRIENCYWVEIWEKDGWKVLLERA